MSGLTDCPPAGCPPVVIQVVLEGVVVSSLLHIVSQRVVVLDYLLTEELPPLLILEVSWPDSMVLGGMSCCCGTKSQHRFLIFIKLFCFFYTSNTSSGTYSPLLVSLGRHFTSLFTPLRSRAPHDF